MRVVVTALAALAIAPADAAALVPQDQSIAGAVVGASGDAERTVRFTVKNNGPGAVAGYSYLLIQPRGLMTIVSAPGCTIRTVAGSTIDARCELGSGLAEGATKSIDTTVRFTDTDYSRDQVLGTAAVSDTLGGNPAGDQNPANDQVTVDLGLTAAPAGMKLEVGIPALQHGTTARPVYVVKNTGGVKLTNVSVTDDHCATPRNPNGLTTIPPLLGFLSELTFLCDMPVPAHHKGEKAPVHHVTATALAGAQTLTVTKSTATYYLEPQRKCGSFKVLRKGKRRTYKALTVRPDVKCKTVRRQLARCVRAHKAPKGYTCRSYSKGKLVWLRPKSGTGVAWMRAERQ